MVTSEDHFKRDVAEGIDYSGLTHDTKRVADQIEKVTRSSEDINRSIGKLADSTNKVSREIAHAAAMTNRSLDAIAGNIALNNTLMRSLIDLTRNPKATAADELYRRGVDALSRQLYPEAIRDLEESITIYNNPNRPEAHFSLGCAHALTDRLEAAAAAFEKVVRYALPEKKELACGAALMAAQAYYALEDYDSAADLLERVSESVPNCPEVALSYVVHVDDGTDRLDYVARVLSVAPEYAQEVYEWTDKDAFDVAVDGIYRRGALSYASYLDSVKSTYAELSSFHRLCTGQDLPPVWAASRRPQPTSVSELHKVPGFLTTTATHLRDGLDQTRSAYSHWRANKEQTIREERDAVARWRNLNTEMHKELRTLALAGIPSLIGILFMLSHILGAPDEFPETLLAPQVVLTSLVIGLPIVATYYSLLTVAEKSRQMHGGTGSYRRVEKWETELKSVDDQSNVLDRAQTLVERWPRARVTPFMDASVSQTGW